MEEEYTNATCKLGKTEAQVTDLQFWDQAIEQEEFIFFSLTKVEKLYTIVEQAFRYRNKKNKYMLVAATLADETGEIFLVGATGLNYGHTTELNVKSHKQAMATVDKEEWNKAIKVEHDKMVKYNVFKVINQNDLPQGTKLFDSTWAMKKKPNGTYRARNGIWGFMQQDVKHFDSHDKSSRWCQQ